MVSRRNAEWVMLGRASIVDDGVCHFGSNRRRWTVLSEGDERGGRRAPNSSIALRIESMLPFSAVA